MNRFLNWLGNLLFPAEAARKAKLQRSTAASRPKPAPVRKSAVSAGAGPLEANKVVPAHSVDSEDNVFIRKYVREEAGTHDSLKIIDESILDNDDEDGIDPYNTGRFDRSKTWAFRSGK